MSHVDRTALGGSTLNTKWFLDVNTGTHSAPEWTAVNGVMEFKGNKEATVQDDSDFDGSGYKSSVITALNWVLELKLARKASAVATAYDAGQEKLRAISDLEGIANQAEVRWYEVTASGPVAEAYMGYCAVSWSHDGGSMDASDTVTVTLTGQGARTTITHPDAAAAVPTVLSVTPAAGAAAGGLLVRIVGTGFMVAGVDNLVAAAYAGVKFGTVAVGTAWYTASDNVCYAITPAHAAGAVDVKCTNATGASTVMPTFTYS